MNVPSSGMVGATLTPTFTSRLMTESMDGRRSHPRTPIPESCGTTFSKSQDTVFVITYWIFVFRMVSHDGLALTGSQSGSNTAGSSLCDSWSSMPSLASMLTSQCKVIHNKCINPLQPRQMRHMASLKASAPFAWTGWIRFCWSGFC